MSLDIAKVNESDDIKVTIVDSVNFEICEVIFRNQQESSDLKDYDSTTFTTRPDSFPMSDVAEAFLRFTCPADYSDVVVLQVEYLKEGRSIGSSLVQYDTCALKLLKYKVELPRGAKVTLFDDESLEAKYVAWDIPCPNSLPNMTFLQVKAANGREAQITPSAGSQAFELYTELGRRYAVFGEIWSYSFAQILWFADLRVQLADDSWQNCVPTAGEGGSIVTILPQ